MGSYIFRAMADISEALAHEDYEQAHAPDAWAHGNPERAQV
jgi:hypothetical protein